MIRKRKKVACYTLDGKHVATYESITAALKATGIHCSAIGWCIQGWAIINGLKTKCARAGNYMWRDASRYVPSHIKPYSHPLNKKTAKYDVFGNLIDIYDSRKSAFDSTGSQLKTRACLPKEGHTAGTYQFRNATSHKKEKIAPVKRADNLKYDRPIVSRDRKTYEVIKEYENVKAVGGPVSEEPNISFATSTCSVFNGVRWGAVRKKPNPDRWIVAQYTESGDLVTTYPNVATAARAMNVSKQCIHQAVKAYKTEGHTAGGYQWFRKADMNNEIPEHIEPYYPKMGRKVNPRYAEIIKLFNEGYSYKEIYKNFDYSSDMVYRAFKYYGINHKTHTNKK